MTEILFYHLTESTLEQTLPGLLEKCGERGWRCVIQSGSTDKIASLDKHLWDWRSDSFLAHSAERNGHEKDQPIWLTGEDDNPNGAQIRFMVEGATPPDLSSYERGVYVFDGHDEAALAQARERWKIEKAAGHAVTYWQQNPRGGWEKKA